MQSEPVPSITDSPWYWVLAFSLMALLALVVIGPKYGKRQSAMERKYQARQRVADGVKARNNSDDDSRSETLSDRRQFASSGNTLVPLWPLGTILTVVALIAWYMLRRGRLRKLALPHESSPS